MFTKTFADTKTQTKLKIFCAYHKKDKEIPIWKSDCVEPIQVGRAISKEGLGIIGDDTGDNISHKNQNYGEMTGWYWVWKNYLPKIPNSLTLSLTPPTTLSKFSLATAFKSLSWLLTTV